MDDDGARFAFVNLPPFLSGGELPQLLDRNELDGQQSPGTHEWKVRDRRTSVRGGRELIRTVTLAGPELERDRFHELKVAADVDLQVDTNSARIEAVLAELAARIEAGDLPATLYSIQVRIMSMKSGEAPAVAAEQFGLLRSLQGEGGPVFPDAAARAVHISETFLRRAKFAQMLVRLEQDQELAAGLMRGPSTRSPLSKRVFSAHDSMMMGLTLTDSFLDPLFGCLPASTWAFSSRRALSSVIFTFGTGVAERRDVPRSLNSLAIRDANMRGVGLSLGSPSPEAWGQAVDWWCSRVDALFSLVADPTRFTDKDNRYLPHFHLAWLMNLDELFRRVGTITSVWDSAYATRTLAFAALDLIGEVWRGSDMSAMCATGRANEAWANVVASVPTSIQSILLPAARAAMASLDEITTGFYISESSLDDLVFVMPDGSIKTEARDRALANLMRARRNATHGFTGKWADPNKPGSKAMAHHDGSIPSTFCLLPYLYLLDILCDPEARLNTAVGRTRKQFLPA
ncbi:hypothetical protein [Rhodococcus erythropolis]|uniref:hypothetical protein n=1 Tax=Rhodococcus erythropolis TaxID=1833 RepID=UPI001BE80457|nr:hypothetical protein [Rhodococcus erythropolis]MBT2269849.1 hypothetical protein [Rhodococcus erythropolis]